MKRRTLISVRASGTAPQFAMQAVTKRQAGLTMIEMMIAIVLSSIVAYAGISMFIASSGTASTTSGVGAVTDSGRVALDFVSDSVRSGGALQCNSISGQRGYIYPNPTAVTTKNILNVGATPLQLDYAEAFGGFEAAGTGVGGTATVAATPVAADPAGTDWATLTPVGVANLDGLLASQVIKGSDVVAVRESVPQDTPVYTVNPYNSPGGGSALQVYSTGTLQPLEYAVVSDCSFATVFQIAAVNPVTNTIYSDGPLDLGGGDLGWSFLANSAITPIDMSVYFIGAGRDTDSSLYSYDEWTGTFQELVPDVENMQILYGVAQTAPGQVTNYVTADHVIDFNQVVNVQIALLVASPPGTRAVAQPAVAPTYDLLGTTVTAPIDTRLRRVFQTTITVENAN